MQKSEVTAYQISRSNGLLQKLNAVHAGGQGPCFIGLDKGGAMAMTAQYSDGTVSSHRVAKDGKLGDVVNVIQHQGKGPNLERQEGPHAHSIRPTPDNRYAFACDLGADKVFIYRIDPVTGTLTPHGQAELPPGSGPRHIAFHPNGRFVFVNNEMLMTVSTFAYDAQEGFAESAAHGFHAAGGRPETGGAKHG
jgi:6-phosphogluconolactonase